MRSNSPHGALHPLPVFEPHAFPKINSSVVENAFGCQSACAQTVLPLGPAFGAVSAYETCILDGGPSMYVVWGLIHFPIYSVFPSTVLSIHVLAEGVSWHVLKRIFPGYSLRDFYDHLAVTKSKALTEDTVIGTAIRAQSSPVPGVKVEHFSSRSHMNIT